MSKKHIILFAPLFYGYWKHIKRELETLGYEVEFITYRTNKLIDGIIDLSGKSIKQQSYDTIVEKRIRKLKGKYYYLIVIKGLFFSQKNFELIKNLNPGIKTIMYQWDSVKNHNYLDFTKTFDKVFTFDPIDAKTYGLEYLPLFYTNDIIESHNSYNGPEDIDLLLIGIYNKSRYEYLQRLKRLSPQLKIYTHLVIPPGLYIRKELISHELGIKDRSDYKFSSISREQLIELYCRSKVFVDICQNQSGMSMRTIEAYGMNKKLITNNYSNIQSDSIISDMDIIQSDSTDKEILELVMRPSKIYQYKESLSLNNWCKKLLS